MAAQSVATCDEPLPPASLVNRHAAMLALGMIVLGLVSFAAMLGFVAFCDRV